MNVILPAIKAHFPKYLKKYRKTAIWFLADKELSPCTGLSRLTKIKIIYIALKIYQKEFQGHLLLKDSFLKSILLKMPFLLNIKIP